MQNNSSVFLDFSRFHAAVGKPGFLAISTFLFFFFNFVLLQTGKLQDFFSAFATTEYVNILSTRPLV